jgi:hypothetical protein
MLPTYCTNIIFPEKSLFKSNCRTYRGKRSGVFEIGIYLSFVVLVSLCSPVGWVIPFTPKASSGRQFTHQ